MPTIETVQTGLVEHSTAIELANAWSRHSRRIRELIVELGEECAGLMAAFHTESIHPGSFDIGVNFRGRTCYGANEEQADQLVK